MIKHIRLVDELDNFIPERIREGFGTTPLMRVQARILVAVLGFSILVPFFGLVIFFMLQAITGIDFTAALISIIAVLILLILQHLLFQASGNLYRTGMAYSINFFISILVSICITGGWHSPALMLFLFAPVITLLTTGYRAAVFCTVIVFLTGLGLWVADVNDIRLPDVMPPEAHPYSLAVTWFMASAIILLLLTAYEWVMEVEQGVVRPD